MSINIFVILKIVIFLFLFSVFCCFFICHWFMMHSAMELNLNPVFIFVTTPGVAVYCLLRYLKIVSLSTFLQIELWLVKENNSKHFKKLSVHYLSLHGINWTKTTEITSQNMNQVSRLQNCVSFLHISYCCICKFKCDSKIAQSTKSFLLIQCMLILCSQPMSMDNGICTSKMSKLLFIIVQKYRPWN